MKYTFELIWLFDAIWLRLSKAKNKNTFVSPHFGILKSGRGGRHNNFIFFQDMTVLGVTRAVHMGFWTADHAVWSAPPLVLIGDHPVWITDSLPADRESQHGP